MKTTHNGFAPIIAVLALLVLLAGGGYYYTTQMGTEVTDVTAGTTVEDFVNGTDSQPMPTEEMIPVPELDMSVEQFNANTPSKSDDVTSIEADLSGAEFDSMMASLDADLAGL